MPTPLTDRLTESKGFEAVAFSKKSGFLFRKLFPCELGTGVAWNRAVNCLVQKYQLSASKERDLREAGEVRLNEDLAVGVTHYAPNDP
jgi:hypothetical protein